MNIWEALKQLREDRRLYFEWKFDIRFDRRKEKLTEDEFLRQVNKRTMNGFIRWERTQEYKDLVALYLQSRTANDLQEIYHAVSEKAKKGDEKAVRLFLSLTKEISEHAKHAQKAFGNVETEEDEEDELIV